MAKPKIINVWNPEPIPYTTKVTMANPWSIATTPAQIGEKVWNNFVKCQGSVEDTYRENASKAWGVEAQRWRLSLEPAYEPYRAIYGFIYNASWWRNLRPEFLHAVVFGEGLMLFVHECVKFKLPLETAKINAYEYLGLDRIGTDLPMFVSKGLIAEKYAKSYSQPSNMKSQKNELNEIVNTGVVIGFEAAVEMIATELSWRLDLMRQVAFANEVVIESQEAIEFLMYAKYVSKIEAERQLTSTEALRKNCSPWNKATDGEWPSSVTDKHFYRYQALIRLATTKWYVDASIYSLPSMR